MTLCPVALAVGCQKCPVFKVCPLKNVLGDQPSAAAAEAAKVATPAAAVPRKGAPAKAAAKWPGRVAAKSRTKSAAKPAAKSEEKPATKPAAKATKKAAPKPVVPAAAPTLTGDTPASRTSRKKK